MHRVAAPVLASFCARARPRRGQGAAVRAVVSLGVLAATCCLPAAAQTPGASAPGASGDLFAPLTNLFNEAALSLSGAFGLAYATAALLVAGAVIVADHRNGVRNALWVIIGSVVLFFGGQIIRMIHG